MAEKYLSDNFCIGFFLGGREDEDKRMVKLGFILFLSFKTAIFGHIYF